MVCSKFRFFRTLGLFEVWVCAKFGFVRLHRSASIIIYKKRFQKNLTFRPRQGPWPLAWAIHLNLYKYQIKDFFSFNQWCLFIKWEVEARTTLFMQNYLFNIVMQGNLWMICTFLFWQKKTNSFLQLNCRYSKANNFSQVVPWPIQDYRRMYSHFLSGPRHGLWHSYKELFVIPY